MRSIYSWILEIQIYSLIKTVRPVSHQDGMRGPVIITFWKARSSYRQPHTTTSQPIYNLYSLLPPPHHIHPRVADMSNVVVLYNQRRLVIKTTPGKSLSEIRTEACSGFGIEQPSTFILK